MKIAALADIHGNYQALVTVIDHLERWKPDLVMVLGDIINRGPRSRDCLHLVQEKTQSASWLVIRGNHEGYVLAFEDPNFSRSGLEFELRKIIFWTYQSLSTDEIIAVKQLPEQIDLILAGKQVVKAVHASTAGDRVGIYPNSSESDLDHLVDPEADLFLVGHTHQPLIRDYQGTTVINVGSVGLPFDGDTRAAYAQISYTGNHWRGEICRVKYDLESSKKDFFETGFIPESGPLADLVLAELELGWPQLSHWFRHYEKAVLDHKISPADAVREFLKNPNIEYLNKDTLEQKVNQ